jgi:hypothetical protein
MTTNNNATFIFECLLRDNAFMGALDKYIDTTLQNTMTFSVENVPSLVLLIMTLLTQGKNYIDVGKNLKNDEELKQLLEIFYDYIVARIQTYTAAKGQIFQEPEFKISFDICIKLAVMKIKFNKKKLACCW